jgi:hypothetical protein
MLNQHQHLLQTLTQNPILDITIQYYDIPITATMSFVCAAKGYLMNSNVLSIFIKVGYNFSCVEGLE